MVWFANDNPVNRPRGDTVRTPDNNMVRLMDDDLLRRTHNDLVAIFPNNAPLRGVGRDRDALGGEESGSRLRVGCGGGPRRRGAAGSGLRGFRGKQRCGCPLPLRYRPARLPQFPSKITNDRWLFQPPTASPTSLPAPLTTRTCSRASAGELKRTSTCRYFCGVASVAAAAAPRTLLSLVALTICHGDESVAGPSGGAAAQIAANSRAAATWIARIPPLLDSVRLLYRIYRKGRRQRGDSPPGIAHRRRPESLARFQCSRNRTFRQ